MGDPILKKVRRLVGKAIGDFNLIEEGDRVLVALSGGKDSWTLLYTLLELQRRAPVKYEVGAVTVHPGSEEFNTTALEDRLSRDKVRFRIVQGRIADIVSKHLTEGTNPCSFCSRLRRGILYTYAYRAGWNKIALGHHLDDFVETLLLNAFFNAVIKGMSPNLVSDDGRNNVIRPLVYVAEDMARACAERLAVPLVGCTCSYRDPSRNRREWVKQLLRNVEQEVPDVRSSLLSSMGRVQMRHLLVPKHKEPEH
jgi:tRNA 2-thiocytidine biosynthesis protein TtcA